MATRDCVKKDQDTIPGVMVFEWSGLLNGDDGTSLIAPMHSDKTIQLKGTLGAGGTVAIEGSNDVGAETWAVLNDPQGNALTINAAKIEALLENPYKIRPHVTAGDGTTNLTVTICISTVR